MYIITDRYTIDKNTIKTRYKLFETSQLDNCISVFSQLIKTNLDITSLSDHTVSILHSTETNLSKTDDEFIRWFIDNNPSYIFETSTIETNEAYSTLNILLDDEFEIICVNRIFSIKERR